VSAALDYLNDRDGLYKELAERSLRHFIKQAWSIVEPSYVFRSNWHIDAISDHLEALRNREIRQLIINIPPRCMKSLAASVFFPSWVWTNEPSAKFVYASYAQTLSVRDSMKMRRIVTSEWFQKNWPIQLETDSNQKIKFENVATGYRIATSVEGIATGEGGDFVACDDPHNVNEAESVAKREGTVTWWDETMSSRLNDPKTGCRFIIMQRVHDRDITGHLLETGGWEHLCLPMEYDPKRKCIIETTGFKDPRSKEGELLFEEHVGQKEIKTLKTNMGPYAYAGQYDQNPVPRKGTMLDVDNIDVRAEPSAPIKREVRGWDKAGTEGGGARTAGVKLAILTNGKICITDVVKFQFSAAKREKAIKNTAEMDGKKIRIYIEQEGGSGGKESAEGTISNLAGFKAYHEPPRGDKEVRAEPLAIQLDVSNVEVLARGWTAEYIDELRKFPVGKFKDQVDATSLALKKATDNTGRVHVG
tara:strand:- start:1169 stop:2593 length:1425 start_codon:yes stop_codon:yes gene_type:complete